MKKSKVTRAFLILSMYLLLFWGILGTSASLAWFSDTTPVAKNTFQVGLLDVEVFYKNDGMSDYAQLMGNTPVFRENAVYEPGYTQVIYLRIENHGNVPFQYKAAISAVDGPQRLNKFGMPFTLSPYLRFGILFGDTEPELTRTLAQAAATYPLNTYSYPDSVEVAAGASRYAALVVYMPETVGDEANYHPSSAAPQIDMGVTIFAQQINTNMT